MPSKGTGVQWRIFFGLLCLGVLTWIYFASPSLQIELDVIHQLLRAGDPQQLEVYLSSYGAKAWFISILLMVFVTVLTPFPLFFLVIANGLVFGMGGGCTVSWVGAMIGAVLSFMISKTVGRPVATRLLGEKRLYKMDRFFERKGRWALLIARLTPVVSFHLLNYASGFTSLSFRDYVVMTGVGILPAIIVTCYSMNLLRIYWV